MSRFLYLTKDHLAYLQPEADSELWKGAKLELTGDIMSFF